MGPNADPGRIVKIVAVFVAGVVISIGSALIYSIHEQRQLDRKSRAFLQTHPLPVTRAPAVQKVQDSESSAPDAAPRPELDPATGSAHESKPSAANSVQPTDALPRVRTAPVPVSSKPLLPGRSVTRKPSRRQDVPSARLPEDSASVPDTGKSAADPHLSPEPAVSSSQAAANPPPLSSAPPPHTLAVTLQPGTTLSVRLKEPLSNTSAHAGDMFHAVLDSPLARDGVIVADRGSAVLGRIVTARRSHLMHGAAELALTLTQFTTSDGRTIPVQTNAWERVGGRTGLLGKAKKIAGAAVNTVTGAVSGAARVVGVDTETGNESGASSRNQLVVPAHTLLTFRLAIPVTITANPAK